MCGVHLGTGIYLTFLQFRSVTSKNADVNGGVTSVRQKGEHVYTLVAFIHLLWFHKIILFPLNSSYLNSDLWGRAPSGAPCLVEGPVPPDWLRAD